MPRVWTGKEDVRKITEEARAVVLIILFVFYIIFAKFLCLCLFGNPYGYPFSYKHKFFRNILCAGSETFSCNGSHPAG